MDEETKSKIKYAIMLSVIVIVISFIFLLFEIITKGNSVVFWTILLLCNVVVLVLCYTELKEE